MDLGYLLTSDTFITVILMQCLAIDTTYLTTFIYLSNKICIVLHARQIKAIKYQVFIVKYNIETQY